MVGGTLDEFGLRDLIQVYCSTRQTARLTVNYPDEEGRFYFEQGNIVHAELGTLSGVAAVNAAIAKTGGEFHVDLGVRSPRRTVTEHWTSIVLNGMATAGARSTPVRPTDADAVPGRRSEPSAAPFAPPPAAAPALLPTPPISEREASMISPPMEPSVLSWTHSGPIVAPGPHSRERAPASPKRSRIPGLVGAGVFVLVLVGGLLWYLRPETGVRPPAPKPVATPEDPTISLGMSAAMTGPAKELGRQMKLGVETCLKAVNDAGGINGHKFVLIALDDGYEPERTKATMKELVDDRKVFAIVGNVGTPTAEVAVPYALEKKIPFFGAFTGAGLLRKVPPDRYVFNYRASYVEETSSVVRYLVEIRKIKPNQIAVFAQQDGFGDAGFTGVTRALRRYGRDKDQILRVGFKRNTLEIGDAVDEILKNRAQIRAVVMVAPYRPAARFIEKLKEAKFEPIFTNVSFVGSTALAEELRQLGPSYAAGIIVTQVVPPVDSSATAPLRYREALARYFRGEKPDFVSLEGYIATNVLMEGFRRAGKNPTQESLVDALESIHGLDLGIGTPLTFGLSEHQASHKVWGTVLDEKANFQVFDLE
jgi:branched-chain amino acid transport system substrate-binding protein